MNGIMDKIEQTLKILDPAVITILTTLHLTSVIPEVQMWEFVALEIIGVVSLISGVWTTKNGSL